MSIKAVFFDIDGTLVSFNTHKVAQSSIDAIEKLRKKGIKVFVATGRHKSVINNLGDLEFDGYVTINGSYCIVGEKVIYKHPIPKKDIETALWYLKNKENFPVMFIHEAESYINFFNDQTYKVLKLLNFPQPPVRPIEEVSESGLFQLIAFFGLEKEKQVMPYLPDCESTRWNDLFTDITPKGSGKHVGIDKVLEYLNISIDEAMAFGDGGNDISMLEHVGLSVAMENASDEVKSKADYVTTSVDDDGVANALKHFGLL